MGSDKHDFNDFIQKFSVFFQFNENDTADASQENEENFFFCCFTKQNHGILE